MPSVELIRESASSEEPPTGDLGVSWHLIIEIELILIVLEAAEFLAAHDSLTLALQCPLTFQSSLPLPFLL